MKALLFVLLAVPSLLLAAQVAEVDHSRCKKEIVESYKLNGHLTPRPVNFYLCPALKSSCCSMYDQFMMFSTWREQIKVKFDNYYAGIESKLKKTKEMLKAIFKINIKDLIEKLPMEQQKKDEVLQKFMLLKDKNLYKLTDQVLSLFYNNRDFMMQLRSTFYCNICDHTSHRYIDVERKIMYLSQSSCDDIAMNTINFSYFLNIELAQYLMDFSKLLLNFSISSSDRPVTISRFKKVRTNVLKCANVFKSGLTDYKKCIRYCQYYKMNANSPVIEGYQVFFNEMINAMEKFLRNHGPEVVKKDDDDDDDDDDKNGLRVLAEKDGKSDSIKNAAASNDDVESFNFDANDLEQVDPYDEKGIDPNFDDYVLHKMFSFEKDYVKDRQQNYVNFVKNKLHFIDVEYDFENADENDLFKTSSRIIVELEDFSTKIRSHGVDISKHLYTTNIDKSLRDLISHLKSRSKYRIMYEKLDPTLLGQINDITNDDVKNYHRDNFLQFTDFSLLLKQEEIMNNYDTVARRSRKKGYYIY